MIWKCNDCKKEIPKGEEWGDKRMISSIAYTRDWPLCRSCFFERVEWRQKQYPKIIKFLLKCLLGTVFFI